MGTIVLTSTLSQANQVKHCRTSKEALETLREAHRPAGPMRKVTLFQELVNLLMGDDDCAQQYIGNFTALVKSSQKLV